MIVLGLLVDIWLTSFLFSNLTPTEFTEPPEDFPVLSITVEMNQPGLAQHWCPGIINLRGCSVVNFDDMTCRIFIVDNSEEKLREELSHRHCEGSDHKGENTISGYWERWKQENRK